MSSKHDSIEENLDSSPTTKDPGISNPEEKKNPDQDLQLLKEILEQLKANLAWVDVELEIKPALLGKRFSDWYHDLSLREKLSYNLSHFSYKEKVALFALLTGFIPALCFLTYGNQLLGETVVSPLNYAFFCWIVILTAAELAASILDRHKAKNQHVGLDAPVVIKTIQTIGMFGVVLGFGLENYHYHYEIMHLSLATGVDIFLGLLAVSAVFHMLLTIYHWFRFDCDKTKPERKQDLLALLQNAIVVAGLTMIGMGFGEIAGADRLAGVTSSFYAFLLASAGITLLLGQLLWGLKGAHLHTNELRWVNVNSEWEGRIFKPEAKDPKVETPSAEDDPLISPDSITSDQKSSSKPKLDSLQHLGFLTGLSSPREVTVTQSLREQIRHTLQVLDKEIDHLAGQSISLDQIEKKTFLCDLRSLIADPLGDKRDASLRRVSQELDNLKQKLNISGMLLPKEGRKSDDFSESKSNRQFWETGSFSLRTFAEEKYGKENVQRYLDSLNCSRVHTPGGAQDAAAAAVTCIAAMQAAVKLECFRGNNSTPQLVVENLFRNILKLGQDTPAQLDYLSPFQITAPGR